MRLLRRHKFLKKVRKMRNHLVIVIDVDGVLTDGTFWYTYKGKELKRFAPHDAEALTNLARVFPIKVISADFRGEAISRRRVEDLGFTLDMVNSSQRAEYLSSFQIQGEMVLFIGDSQSDIAALEIADISACPFDAAHGVNKHVDFRLSTRGGRGVMAEIYHLLRLALKNEVGFENL